MGTKMQGEWTRGCWTQIANRMCTNSLDIANKKQNALKNVLQSGAFSGHPYSTEANDLNRRQIISLFSLCMYRMGKLIAFARMSIIIKCLNTVRCHFWDKAFIYLVNYLFFSIHHLLNFWTLYTKMSTHLS